MKRALSLFMAIVMVLSLCSVTALGKEQVTVTFQLNNASASWTAPCTGEVTKDKDTKFNKFVEALTYSCPGYEVEKWTTGQNGSGTNWSDKTGDQAKVSSSITVYAQWKEIEKTVTFDANGGSFAMVSTSKNFDDTVKQVGTGDIKKVSVTLKGTATAEFSNFTAKLDEYVTYSQTGKVFEKWVKDNGQAIGATECPATAKAKWKDIPSVTFNANGGAFTLKAEKSFSAGEVEKVGEGDTIAKVKVTLNSTSFSDFTAKLDEYVTYSHSTKLFKAWVKNNGQAIGATECPAEVKADWKDAVTVTFNPNGGNWSGSTDARDVKIAKGLKFSEISNDDMPANPTAPAGKTFAGWYTKTGEEYKAVESTVAINAAVTYYALYAPAVVTFDANGGKWDATTTQKTANVTVLGTEYKDVTKPADPKVAPAAHSDYVFAGWYTKVACADADAAKDNAKIMTDVTYYAKWVAPVTVTFYGNGGAWGTATTTEIKVAPGTKFSEITVDEPTQDGKVFFSWQEKNPGGQLKEIDVETPINTDKDVYAKWADAASVTFHFNYDGADPAFVKADLADGVKFEKQINVPEVPARYGFAFKGWSTTESGNPIDKNYKIASGTDLYAQWKEVTSYTVEFHIGCASEYIVEPNENNKEQIKKKIAWSNKDTTGGGPADATITLQVADYPDGMTFEDFTKALATNTNYGTPVYKGQAVYLFDSWLTKHLGEGGEKVNSDVKIEEISKDGAKFTVHALFTDRISLDQDAISVKAVVYPRVYNTAGQPLRTQSQNFWREPVTVVDNTNPANPYTLIEGTDYYITYVPDESTPNAALSEAGEPVNAGRYTVVITGMGKYKDSVALERQLVIFARDINECNISYKKASRLKVPFVSVAKAAPEFENKTGYDFKIVEPINNTELVMGKDYVVAKDGNKLIVTGIGNYCLSKTIKLTTSTTTTTKTTSAKTFDAGIALYVGMSIAAVTGSAVVIGKKKEF